MTGSANVNSAMLSYQIATVAFLGVFALYDIQYHRVRNSALLCFFPWCLLSLPIAALTTGFPFAHLAFKAALGFLNGGLILLVVAFITGGGIGGGDIKLTALLGILCGTGRICFLLLAASVAALLFFLLKNAQTGKQEGRLPFVPFLFAGFLLSLIYK